MDNRRPKSRRCIAGDLEARSRFRIARLLRIRWWWLLNLDLPRSTMREYRSTYEESVESSPVVEDRNHTMAVVLTTTSGSRWCCRPFLWSLSRRSRRVWQKVPDLSKTRTRRLEASDLSETNVVPQVWPGDKVELICSQFLLKFRSGLFLLKGILFLFWNQVKLITQMIIVEGN